jgi:uncharacterized membrane protein YecN with MAPEG domain
MLDFSLSISLLFASINGLIFLVLSALVVRGRFSEQVSIGAGGKERLEVAIRVHGNFAEYVPFALLLLALLEASGTSDTVLYSLGAILTIARLSHAYGLSRTLAPNAFRAGGTMATWVVIGASCLIGLYQVAT